MSLASAMPDPSRPDIDKLVRALVMEEAEMDTDDAETAISEAFGKNVDMALNVFNEGRPPSDIDAASEVKVSCDIDAANQVKVSSDNVAANEVKVSSDASKATATESKSDANKRKKKENEERNQQKAFKNYADRNGIDARTVKMRML